MAWLALTGALNLHMCIPARSDPPYIVNRRQATYYLRNQERLLVPPSIHHRIGGNYFDHFQEFYRKQGLQNENAVQQWTAIYYGMVTQVDAQVGELLDELALQKVDKNTLGKCRTSRCVICWGFAIDACEIVIHGVVCGTDRYKVHRLSRLSPLILLSNSALAVCQSSLRQITESTYQHMDFRYVNAAAGVEALIVGGLAAIAGSGKRVGCLAVET